MNSSGGSDLVFAHDSVRPSDQPAFPTAGIDRNSSTEVDNRSDRGAAALRISPRSCIARREIGVAPLRRRRPGATWTSRRPCGLCPPELAGAAPPQSVGGPLTDCS